MWRFSFSRGESCYNKPGEFPLVGRALPVSLSVSEKISNPPHNISAISRQRKKLKWQSGKVGSRNVSVVVCGIGVPDPCSKTVQLRYQIHQITRVTHWADPGVGPSCNLSATLFSQNPQPSLGTLCESPEREGQHSGTDRSRKIEGLESEGATYDQGLVRSAENDGKL